MSTATVPGVLLIGAGGMLGRAWRERFSPEQSPATPRFDITDPQAVAAHLVDDVRTVINCAAFTDVDGAESRPDEAQKVNADAAGYLAERCRAIDATLVHYSTDYVFNGQADTPYRMDEPRDPVNAYGRSKAMGEVAIEQSGCDHLIIRTSWLYAPWGRNFVRTIAKLCAQRSSLRVVDDQRGRPTSCEHLAQVSAQLLERHVRGIRHVTDGGECTWFEFAREIARLANADCAVEPCTTAEFPRPAKRPAYSVLDLSETETVVGPMPDWRDNLKNVLQRLEP